MEALGGKSFDIPEKRISVSFSGILLNLPELRLAPAETEPEVIARMYAEKGPEAFALLDGPFVAAISVSRENPCTMLVRDLHGQKGLFYRIDSKGTCFFSENPKDIIPREKEYDLNALTTYFSLGYIPAPQTAYKNVCKLANASYVMLTESGCHTKKYWLPEFTPQSFSFEEATEQAHTLLQQAVKRCLAIDSNAGILLSGGIDSNLMLAITKQVSNNAPMAFTVGFSHKSFDERALAAISAQAMGAQHITAQVTPADYQHAKEILSAYGEPYADSSLLPDNAAMRLASQHVKTVITGDGGDELFGGYRRYQAMALRSRFGNLPSRLLGICAKNAMGLLPASMLRKPKYAEMLRLSKAFCRPNIPCYAAFQEIFDPKATEQFSRTFFNCLAEENYLGRWEELSKECKGSLVEKCNYLDLISYLPDDCCRKEMLAASGTGLTVLSPILDIDVTKFAMSLPLAMKLNRHEGKRILRSIASKLLPDELMNFTKKGFGMPTSDWMRGELSGETNKLISAHSEWDKEEWIRDDMLQWLVACHNANARDFGSKLWALNAYRIWKQSEAIQ